MEMLTILFAIAAIISVSLVFGESLLNLVDVG